MVTHAGSATTQRAVSRVTRATGTPAAQGDTLWVGPQSHGKGS
jgi:hypothetical protein